MPDKVKFNVKNLHYAVMDESEGTYETPVAIPGTVNLSMNPNGGTEPFYADGIQYFTTVANNGYTGDIEVAYFPDGFLTDVFGATTSTTDKVMTESSGIQPKNIALLFQEDGDAVGTKFVLYNVKCDRPSRTLATTTETITPQTQTISFEASPLTDQRIMAMTTAETPKTVLDNWYKSVWVGDSTTGSSVSETY